MPREDVVAEDAKVRAAAIEYIVDAREYFDFVRHPPAAVKIEQRVAGDLAVCILVVLVAAQAARAARKQIDTERELVGRVQVEPHAQRLRRDARNPTHKIMSINLSIGSRLPSHCTSMGRVLLSELSQSELEAHFSACPPTAMTPRTITDVKTLISTVRQVRTNGWCLVNRALELVWSQ